MLADRVGAKRCSQQALADRLEVHSEGTGVSLVCAPGPAAVKAGRDAAVRGGRGVEDVVPAEFGLACLAGKAPAEGLFFPKHRTSFGFDSGWIAGLNFAGGVISVPTTPSGSTAKPPVLCAIPAAAHPK